MTILQSEWIGEEAAPPWRFIDIHFHDAQVRNDSAEMRAHHTRQRTGESMRRHIDFVGVAHAGHAQGFRQSIIHGVDDRHINGTLFKIGPKRLPAEYGFERSNRRGGGLPDM